MHLMYQERLLKISHSCIVIIKFFDGIKNKLQFAFQMFFYKLTKNQKFDIAIMLIILLNMTSMAVEHHRQTQNFEIALAYVNIVFITIFTIECVMKLLGFRQHYFKEPWNIFDFIVVVVSLLSKSTEYFEIKNLKNKILKNIYLIPTAMALQEYFTKLPISPTLLRVVRVFRVGRVLRLVKSAKGIRTLLFSLAVSMPALFNIGLLLFLIMFIYAIVGMSCFMYVKHTGGIDDMFNFESFANSMIVLFQTCTSAGWEGILAGLMNDKPPGCSADPVPPSPSSDCGNSALGIFYLCSYLVITFLVVINMYIAVILENFSQATEDVQQGLTQDDFDMYYELWERYDEKATQYIPLFHLSEFVDALEDPLRIPYPNFYKLVQLDIPICEGDMVNCVDILDALTKNFLGTKDDAAEELGDLKKPGRLNYHPISSTLQRQREIFTVKIIQRMWRNFVSKKRGVENDDDETENDDNCKEKKDYDSSSRSSSTSNKSGYASRSNNKRKNKIFSDYYLGAKNSENKIKSEKSFYSDNIEKSDFDKLKTTSNDDNGDDNFDDNTEEKICNLINGGLMEACENTRYAMERNNNKDNSGHSIGKDNSGKNIMEDCRIGDFDEDDEEEEFDDDDVMRCLVEVHYDRNSVRSEAVKKSKENLKKL